MDYDRYMRRALQLAQQGWPDVAPNPMTGCVIVRDQKIIAEGFHKEYGKSHAEVNAINKLPEEIDPSECTLYVTLEPCSHYGKTPPCADLIIKKGFKKVVVCNTDPNPLVAGAGIEKLRKAGIEVITGILEEEGNDLNKRFFTFHRKKRPFITLKWTQTADGFISRKPVPKNREENMIGTPAQLEQVHRLRAETMGIMVGKNTVLFDNPALTTRLVKGKNPTRIFIDKGLAVPFSYTIYNTEANTIVFNNKRTGQENHIRFIQIDFSANVLAQVLFKLYELNIQSLLVEGGLILLNHFLSQDLYDEIIVFENKALTFGEGTPAPVVPKTAKVSVR